MNRASEKAHIAHKDALVDAELQRFMDCVIGKDRFDYGGGDRFASSIMRRRRR